jgi:hypothetical protein
MNGCDGIFYCTVIYQRYNCDLYVLRGGNVDVGLVEPFYLRNASWLSYEREGSELTASSCLCSPSLSIRDDPFKYCPRERTTQTTSKSSPHASFRGH